jgi:FkbM family methyltransferase
MRRIREISEHSVYVPGLQNGVVLDVGANKGRFGRGILAVFPVRVVSVEANPKLAMLLRQQGIQVIECALGARDGPEHFNIGHNDEASSTRTPQGLNAHLVVRQTLRVPMKTLKTLLVEQKISRATCVKLDIEGAEIDVLMSVGTSASEIAPQWTVEFHDGPEFQLCKAGEVDAAIAGMKSVGFSVLVRNWPARTNVLFLKRDALSIGLFEWVALKIRYQYLAVVWRKCRGLR